jgi:hypothetical protein
MQQERFRINSIANPMCLALRFAAFLALLTCHPLLSAEVRFSASLDRDSVLVGESVGLVLKFEGASIRGEPSLPQIPGIQVAPGISTSFSSTVDSDGTATSIQSYTYNLVPTQPGEFVIPPLQVDVGGRRLSSQPLHLRVLASDPSSPASDLANSLAFLSLVLPKKELYVGEAMVAELRLYIRNGVANVSDLNVPSLPRKGSTAASSFPSNNTSVASTTRPSRSSPFSHPWSRSKPAPSPSAPSTAASSSTCRPRNRGALSASTVDRKSVV